MGRSYRGRSPPHALDGVLVYIVGVGEYRSLGVDADDSDVGALLFQVAARSVMVPQVPIPRRNV